MIDTHCHIDFDEFDEDRKDVIARAKEKLNAVINFTLLRHTEAYPVSSPL